MNAVQTAAPTTEVIATGERTRIYAGVFFTSLAVLIAEISLTRVFAFAAWYHFVYMVISVALLGIGASGTFLSVFPGLLKGGARKALFWSALAGACATPICLFIISKVPFHPVDLLAGPGQFLNMTVNYLAAIVPFFFGGLTIVIALRSMPERVNSLYFWDLVGAALGCAAVVLLIWLWGAVSAVLSYSIFMSLAAFCFAPRTGRRFRAGAIGVAAASVILFATGSSLYRIMPAEGKFLDGWMKDENTEIIFSEWTPLFRVDVVKWKDEDELGDALPFERLDQAYLGETRGFRMISHDGDACSGMFNFDGDVSKLRSFDNSVWRFPYLVQEEPSVLIVGVGGGVDVLNAVRNRASSVTGVEIDPVTVRVVKEDHAEYTGHLFNRPEVGYIAGEGRSFVRHHKATDKFDIVQFTAVDTLTALSTGAYVLSESYLFTLDGYSDYLDILTDNGVLSVLSFDYSEPSLASFTVKHCSLALDALERRGIARPSDHIVVVATKPPGVTMTNILVKKTRFTDTELTRIRQFAEENDFSIWHLPGVRKANFISVLANSSRMAREDIYSRHRLNIRSTTDDKPFFFNLNKWSSLTSFDWLRSRSVNLRGQGLGILVLVTILLQSFVFSAILILFPLYKFKRGGLRVPGKWAYLVYFSSIGVAFILIEVSAIQRFVLFLGHPTYSLTVVLSSLLVSAGVGSFLSGKLGLSRRSLLVATVLLLGTVILFYHFFLAGILRQFLGHSLTVRVVITGGLMGLQGILLGVFFPAGIRIIAGAGEDFVPWAWGVNGCASVIGTPTATILAMSFGFRTVALAALAVYLAGVVFLLMHKLAVEGIGNQ